MVTYSVTKIIITCTGFWYHDYGIEWYPSKSKCWKMFLASFMKGLKRFFNSPNEGEKKLSKPELIAVSELNYLKLIWNLKQFNEYILAHSFSTWPRGPMDKASDYESGDSRFESWRGRSFLDETLLKRFHIISQLESHASLYKNSESRWNLYRRDFSEALSKTFYPLEK